MYTYIVIGIYDLAYGTNCTFGSTVTLKWVVVENTSSFQTNFRSGIFRPSIGVSYAVYFKSFCLSLLLTMMVLCSIFHAQR